MISILFPIYNQILDINTFENDFRNCINSIINQTFKKYELLIGLKSNLENIDILKKYEKDNIKFFYFKNLNSKKDLLNELLKQSQYEWISTIELSYIWLPNKLEKQLEYVKEYDVIGTNACFNISIPNNIIVKKIPFYNISKMNFTNENLILKNTYLIKKELYILENNHENLEHELFLKLKNKNKKFYNIPDILVKSMNF